MIFDTDILIWVQRGNQKAAALLTETRERVISIQSYLELLQDAHNKTHHQTIKRVVTQFRFKILPLTPNIGHRALIYIEELALSSGMRAGDAIIAATAVENNLPLISGNHKHFKSIHDLKLKIFNP